jgi:N-acetylmuramoyl-L-alanine amidase
MCQHCDGDDLDRRRFLRRAGGAVAAIAAGVVLPDLVAPGRADALAAPFEYLNMGEDRRRPVATKKKLKPKAPVPPAVTAPTIVTRAQWGADESLRTPDRSFAPIRKLVVHHSASANNPSNPTETVRQIYRYSVTNRNFSDFGYNFAIDHRGTIYEGRYSREYPDGAVHSGEDTSGRGVVGAHAKGVNAGTCGIVLIGNFMLGSPTDAAISSLCDLLAWKASMHQIDPVASDPFINLFGDPRVFPNIAGHRQTGMTLCPGNRLFGRLDAVRAEVQRRVGNFPPVTIDMSKATTYVSTGQSTKSPTASANAKTNAPTAAGPGRSVPIGYRILATDGTVVSFAGAGSPAIARVGNPVGLTHTSSGWFALDRAGAVTAFDGATTYGDLTTRKGKGTPADIAATITGAGYWILTREGGVFAFGDAVDAGSPVRQGARPPSMRIHASASGRGYWVLGGDGSLRAFGDAPTLGSATGLGATPIDFATTPSGAGAWVLGDNGAIVALGDAKRMGDLTNIGVRWSHPAVGILGSLDRGYLVLTHNGGLYAFGQTTFLGSAAGAGLTAAGIAGVF